MLRQDSCGGILMLQGNLLWKFETKRGAENLAAIICPDLKNPIKTKSRTKNSQLKHFLSKLLVLLLFKIKSTPLVADFAKLPCGSKCVIRRFVFLGRRFRHSQSFATVIPLKGDTMVPINTARKVFDSGFYWPTIYKDAHDFVHAVVTFVHRQRKNYATVMRCHTTPEVDINKKTENQAKMTKLSMEWKRLCKIKAKVQKCQSQSQYRRISSQTGAGTEEYYWMQS
ncbi:hypothetical protein Tco_0877035 [Tanacetum coccineum]|uniref:Uncharacterized protein n=1 Tax=Tanacetum coccineum TaxID=301880 RepID=A0ABQ5BZ99_9ASTR